jgi:hypothetical protein
MIIKQIHKGNITHSYSLSLVQWIIFHFTESRLLSTITPNPKIDENGQKVTIGDKG